MTVKSPRAIKYRKDYADATRILEYNLRKLKVRTDKCLVFIEEIRNIRKEYHGKWGKERIA